MQQSQAMGLHQSLAPQLQQSLQILQAAALELRQMVNQEMATNPVLEEEEREPAEDDNFEEEFEELARLDEEWKDLFSTGSRGLSSEEEEERRQRMLESVVSSTTLQQHLMEQLGFAELNEDEFRIAELIIGNIDDHGFLQSPPEEMSANTGIPLDEVQQVLDVIQGFDPPGVGARDLRECLLIQLRRRGKGESLEARMVADHLDDLAKHRYPVIARKLGISKEQVQYAAESVARLDPRPGQIFAPEQGQYVQPDVRVEWAEGDYRVTLNNEQIPHLRISNTYKDIMSHGGGGREVKEYIRDKIRSGKFLIKSIHQRQETILKIANEIVDRQREFLEQGPSRLRPLNMSQVADAVGVHETTVSRAIAGKYMATPQGTFEMRYFFRPGYQNAEGEELSNTSVKETIADLVRNEDSLKPLSDQEIVEILKERGLPIARRTVAKYRTELNILPSNMRRRY